MYFPLLLIAACHLLFFLFQHTPLQVSRKMIAILARRRVAQVLCLASGHQRLNESLWLYNATAIA
jgi:hypothetical protein